MGAVWMILVSACLAGINSRYNSANKAHRKIIELVMAGQAIPVCPEQLAGLPTPREKSEIKNGRVVTASGKDVTAEFQGGAEEVLRIAKLFGADRVIFKSKSPSCGRGKVYDGTFSGRLVEGNGIATSLLLKNGIKVMTEEEL